jgi:4-amino-4-deoxy-L-arabinose transferase-like glycosyltransferase
VNIFRTNIFLSKLRHGNMLLFFIFLLAFILRVYNLSYLPLNFHTDEVVSTFVGRYTLLHLKDPYGNIFPLFFFNLFGDFPPIFPMYFSGISTFIFGVNEFAARFPFALFGSLVVFPTYLFTKLLFNNKRVSLLSAFFISILPWHIVLSRASGESIIGITILISALYLLFKSAFLNKYLLALISCLLLLSTYFIYPSFRLLVPFVILPLPLLFFRTKIRNILFLILIICCSVTLLITSTIWGKGRFNQTSIFTNPGIAFSIKNNNAALSNDEGSVFVARVFNNKIIGYGKLLLEQYLSYYSPDYLFLHGGFPLRYAVRDNGLLYLVFIFFYLGLFFPSQKLFKRKYFIYIIYLLIIAAIPAALTVDDVPNIRRSTFMLLPLVILASIGFENILVLLKNYSGRFKIFLLICVVIFLLGEFVCFWHQYSQHNSSYKSILRNDGDKEASLYLLNHKQEYRKVFAPSNLIVYYLFYKNDFNQRSFSLGMNVKQIDNIEFINSYDLCYVNKLVQKNTLKKVLFVENGDCDVPENLSLNKLILRKDYTKAYLLLEPEK